MKSEHTPTINAAGPAIRAGLALAMAASAGIARVKVNKDPTDDGVSDFSLPCKGFRRPGEQQENPPWGWPYRPPFLAQVSKILPEQQLWKRIFGRRSGARPTHRFRELPDSLSPVNEELDCHG